MRLAYLHLHFLQPKFKILMALLGLLSVLLIGATGLRHLIFDQVDL